MKKCQSTNLDVYTICFPLVSNEIGSFYFLQLFENSCPSSEAFHSLYHIYNAQGKLGFYKSLHAA